MNRSHPASTTMPMQASRDRGTVAGSELWRLSRRQFLPALGMGCLLGAGRAGAQNAPIVVGLTAEFGVQGSQTAQTIAMGLTLAIEEVNAAGGVLGRPLALETQDDRGVPARGVDNFQTFAARPDVVAVFCGRFSPVALEIAPLAGKLGLPLLDPWAAADGITQQHGRGPNFVFRLSLTDSWAIEAMLDHARARGFQRIAMFVPNTAWGRSSEAAMLAYARRRPGLAYDVYWYNWGETDFGERLSQARSKGAQALLAVTNEFEGLPIVRQMAAFPAAQRMPIISHWGILGGDFGRQARQYLDQLDVAVVHTFSFSDPRSPQAQAVASSVQRRFGIRVEQMRAQVGFAHAYDLMHLLAKAIQKAGSSQRTAVRHSLERLDAHVGLLKRYDPPFTATRHEALDRRQVQIGQFDKDGNLKSIPNR